MKDSTRRWLKRWVIGDISLRRFAGSIVFIYGSLCALTFLLEDRLLYRPHHPASYVDSPEIHKLRSGRFRISARYLEQPGARYTLLYSHGNAEDLEDISVLLEPLHTLGVSVLAYDYAGYGTSEGAPSERQLYADIDAAYRWLVEERGVRAIEDEHQHGARAYPHAPTLRVAVFIVRVVGLFGESLAHGDDNSGLGKSQRKKP